MSDATYPGTASENGDGDRGAGTGGGVFGYLGQHPRGFWFIFWGELAERSSYYGMRAILLLYMSTQLGLGDSVAAVGMSLFIGACYFLPLIGGYVADNYFGKYWTIVGFSVPYILGHVILGVETIPFLIFALVLLAMGSGVIKPNISTLMGLTYDQQRPGQEQLRSDAFAIYYGAINIGSAISTFALPALRNEFGYAIAFLFPAGLMALAFIFFAMGKKYYAVEVIERHASTPEERAQKRAVVGRIFGLFFVICFFWSIFDQQASTWTLFARDLLDLDIFGFAIAPDGVQGFNPVFVLALLPVVTLAWRAFASAGMPLRATDKMTVGFVFTGLSMAIMAVPAFLANRTVHELAEDGYHFVLLDDEATPEVRTIAESGSGGMSRIDTVADVAGLEIADPSKVVFVPQLPLSPEGIYANYAADGYDFVALDADARAKIEAQIRATDGDPEGRVALVGSADEVAGLPFPRESDRIAYAGGASEGVRQALQVRYPDIVGPEIGGPEIVAALEARFPEIAPLPKPSVLWQVFAYVIVTVAELCISVVGLELAFAAAPASMKGFVTGCFLLTVYLGNMINLGITPLYPTMPAWVYFALEAAVMIPVTLAFLFIARNFNKAVERWKQEEARKDSESGTPEEPAQSHVPPGN